MHAMLCKMVLIALMAICLYCLNWTEFGQFILRKITKIVAIRCQISRLNCTKFYFGCFPSSGHISKTNQERPIVTMEHQEVGTADSVAAFKSSKTHPGEIFGFQRQNVSKYYKTTVSCSTWRQIRRQLFSAEHDARRLVRSDVNCSKRSWFGHSHRAHDNRPLCWRRQRPTGGGLASFRSARVNQLPLPRL